MTFCTDFNSVCTSALDGVDLGKLALLVAELGGDALGLLGVVPEVGNAGLLTQIRDLGGELVDANHRSDVGKRGAKGSYLLGNIQLDHVEASLPVRSVSRSVAA
jgi:hypothetical protein